MKQNLKFGLVLDQLAVLKIYEIKLKYATFERFMSNQLTLFQSRGRGQIMLTVRPIGFSDLLIALGYKKEV